MERIFEVSDKQKFRPVPLHRRGTRDESGALYEAEKAKKCCREKGHVLAVRDARIICLECPAIWKDEGF